MQQLLDISLHISLLTFYLLIFCPFLLLLLSSFFWLILLDSGNTETKANSHLLNKWEVTQVIKRMATKSCDLDPMPTWLLKDHLDILVPFITQIVNLSIQSSFLPSALKEAFVCPLLKKPSLDKNVLKNYCPVFTLPFLSMVLEKVIAKRLNDFVAACNMRELYQSACISHHSTETALLKVKMTSANLCCLISLQHLIPLIMVFHSGDLRLGLPSQALHWHGYLLISQIAKRLFLLEKVNPMIVPCAMVYLRAQCLGHFCSPFTLLN